MTNQPAKEYEELDKKDPYGSDLHSLRLNTDIITDTLKDYALKLVANAHSEMSEEQWDTWVNEHTETYSVAIKSEVDRLVAEALRHNLVLFGGELSYCLANKFPVGEGHTPPSMVYESMEPRVDKWLARHQSTKSKGE